MHPRRLFTLLAVLAATLVLPASPARAQAHITGSIRGNVTDDSGNFLPGVNLTVTSEALGDAPRATITDAEGTFVMNGLPVGVYSLEARLIGYRPFEMIQIVIDPDRTVVLNMKLAEGITEKITVQAERPVIDTSNTASKEVVDATYVNKLPLISRRYQQIMTLFPGVSNDKGFTLAQFHVNGGRVTQAGYRIDGATINDFVTGTFGLNVNQNSIERFELNTSGYQAEYGEQSGGIANIITKSGTNTFDLLYSGFFRTESLGSDLKGYEGLIDNADVDGDTDNNNNPRPETQQWQEIAFSGPLVKNRAWFASSFQYWQEDIGSVFNESVRQGDRYHGQFKVTWQATPNNTFVANVATDPSFFDNLITDARYAPGTNYYQNQGNYIVQLRDSHTLSPSAFLENQLFVHHQYLAARPAEEGLGAFQFIVPDSGPLQIVGTYPFDQDRSTDRTRLSSSLTVQKGTHRIKTGLDYSFMDFTGVLRAEDVTINQDAYFESRYGPGSTLRFINDYHNPDRTDRKDGEMAAYAQDTWVVNEHWAVEAGLRWDRQTLVGEDNLAPRFGLSYDPRGKGKTKVYGNYGRFYDSIFTGFVDFLNTDGFTQTVDYYVAGSGGGSYVYAEYDYAIDGDLETPYRDSWTIGVDQELPWNLRVGVSTTRWEGKNQLRTTFTTDLSNVPSSVELDPNATAAVILDTKGRSDYRDFKLTVRKPFSHRFEVIGSYTRSRVRGDASEDFGFESRADQRSLEFTRLEYDRPDVVNLAAFTNLPWGLEVTGIYRYQSGRLFSPTLFLNGAQVIDPDAEGKNSRRMPPVRSLDLSLSKRFDLGRSTVKLTGQVFNVTNELNVIDVETLTAAGGFFARPVDIDFGRIVQFGLEFRF